MPGRRNYLFFARKYYAYSFRLGSTLLNKFYERCMWEELFFAAMEGDI